MSASCSPADMEWHTALEKLYFCYYNRYPANDQCICLSGAIPLILLMFKEQAAHGSNVIAGAFPW